MALFGTPTSSEVKVKGGTNDERELIKRLVQALVSKPDILLIPNQTIRLRFA